MEPAPPGLSERLLRLPRVTATDDQKAALARDGVVRIPSVIRDRRLLSELGPLLVKHEIVGAELPAAWHMSGVSRLLVRDSPLGGLASSIYGGAPVGTEDSQVWRKMPGTWGGGEPNYTGHFHCDDFPVLPPATTRMVSIWLAITDAPVSLGFYNGSHRRGPEMQAMCNRARDKGPRFEYELNRTCIDECARDPAYGFGSPAYLNLSAEAGDAILFNGSTFHAGITHTSERVAYCLRVRPMRIPPAPPCDPDEVVHRDSFTGLPGEFARSKPLPLHPADLVKSHVDCLPWAIAPHLGERQPFAPPSTEGRMSAMSYAKLMRRYLAGQGRVDPMWAPEGLWKHEGR